MSGVVNKMYLLSPILFNQLVNKSDHFDKITRTKNIFSQNNIKNEALPDNQNNIDLKSHNKVGNNVKDISTQTNIDIKDDQINLIDEKNVSTKKNDEQQNESTDLITSDDDSLNNTLDDNNQTVEQKKNTYTFHIRKKNERHTPYTHPIEKNVSKILPASSSSSSSTDTPMKKRMTLRSDLKTKWDKIKHKK